MNNFLATIGTGIYQAAPMMNQMDQQRKAEARQQKLDALTLEEHDMKKQSHAAQIAHWGLQTQKLKTAEDDDAKLREHLLGWRDNRGKIQQGDFAPFMEGLSEYNSNQGWAADGYTLKQRATEDGKASILDRYDTTGKLVESSPPLTRGEVLKLYDMGMVEKMKWLNPARYDQAIKGVAEQQAKLAEQRSREKIAAGNNATTLEAAKVNQGGADRRHAGTLAVQRDRLAWDKERPSGGLTLSQQRANEEIAAAREMLSGLSDEEIDKRSTTTMQNGRENRDFNPAIAQAAKLYRRRLIGDDPWFDKRNQGRQTVQNADTPTLPMLQVTRFRRRPQAASQPAHRFSVHRLHCPQIRTWPATRSARRYWARASRCSTRTESTSASTGRHDERIQIHATGARAGSS